MAFRVGQKVACVRSEGTSVGVVPLVLGRIYTIRHIQADVLQPKRGVGLRFAGIENPLHFNGHEFGYYSDRFRPLVERKTDISIFTAMLTDTRQPVSLGE